MSVDGDGSSESNPPSSSQPQQLTHQDLNFSLNDILSNNHDVNDSSFQSIVQTLSNNSNEQHIVPSYAHLPAELQDLFNNNETDDLLSVQGNNADASILQGDLMWQQQPFIQQKEDSTTPSLQTNVQSPAPTSSPSVSSLHVPNPLNQTASTTLLDNITAQLPPERKDKFIQLFRELQTNQVSAQQFLSKAKTLLGQQEYQQLEDLKNKPVHMKANEEETRKRTLSSQQLRNEDAQRSMSSMIIPQLKRVKTEHIPPQQQQQLQQLQMQLQQQHQMQMLQKQQQQQQQQQQTKAKSKSKVQSPPPSSSSNSPSVQIVQPAVFKTPNTPLQVPTKTNLATPNKSASAPPIPIASNATQTTTSNSNAGDSRIDYDTLTDVMGYAGVDLKEEAEHFMREEEGIHNLLPDGMDRSKAQDFMNPDLLRAKILNCAKCVNITEIDSDFVSYMALATQDRIRTVLEAMVAASKHREFNPFKKPPMTPEGHPLFKIQVKQNVKLQLEAIEQVERQVALDLDPQQQEEEEENDEPMEMGWYSNRSKKPLESKSQERKVTVQDAIFVMERDVQGGRGTNQRTLLKAYNEWLY